MSELPEKIPLIILDPSASPSSFVTHHTKYMDYYYPSRSFSNDFSSAKSCAALVGDSRTPSFPSSVHIPSLTSHQSLLSSRDEVFKEIWNVGELWDEEEEPEEIEARMKVVPSSYHQYLDVFSKVKAENLPPHCACDHHIKLEGSLPPGSDSGKHPIAFYSRKHLSADINYGINDKELLGIVWALKRWRAFLLSLSSSFEVLTNHTSLQYFMLSKILTHHQARWAEFLSEFHFSINYQPGHLTTLPDALSRWDDIYQV
ncbi:hypothetical protein O181_063651 [Austropuccinia psidii MF-1]|uniref:Reverse transcriptase RNase H-like domain-containing protein n=1 Tax=Austropuccinia psidii MF-1 TaxID=1389203 RepID=A0A9Q3EKE5_9BASI|nr:hypothetical protein [Austropuccinia psidii MF-1]